MTVPSAHPPTVMAPSSHPYSQERYSEWNTSSISQGSLFAQQSIAIDSIIDEGFE